MSEAKVSNEVEPDFDAMFEKEKRHVLGFRNVAFQSKDEENEPNFFGLALSGGGIRSATFSLGVIQALAQFKRLRQVDYLSTISGGGYIGCWLSACICRAIEDLLKPEKRNELYELGFSEHDFEIPKIDDLRDKLSQKVVQNEARPKKDKLNLDSIGLTDKQIKKLEELGTGGPFLILYRYFGSAFISREPFDARDFASLNLDSQDWSRLDFDPTEINRLKEATRVLGELDKKISAAAVDRIERSMGRVSSSNHQNSNTEIPPSRAL